MLKSKTWARRGLVIILVLVVMLSVPLVAYATAISVAADSTSVKVGDNVTLTIIVSAENIAVASGAFTYDPALLSYVSSNGGASDGYINLVSAQSGGSDSLTAVIKFVAIGKGDAEVTVSMDSVLSYDEQTLETAKAGVSVSIAPADTPEEPDSESTPPLSLSQTGVPAENVLGATAPMYIWRSLSSLTLPSGFADRQVEYGGEYVNGAAVPDSEDIILLYLSEETGDNAGYYIYSAEKNTLYPYVTITSALAEFMLLWPEDTVKPPEGFEETTINWKDQDMPAWKAPGTDEVYLVYARNAAGESGFYLYNMEDKSVQRYLAPSASQPSVPDEPETASTEKPVTAPVKEEKTDEGITIASGLLIGICALGTLLAAAVVVLAVLYARQSRPGVSRKVKVIKTTGQDAGV